MTDGTGGQSSRRLVVSVVLIVVATGLIAAGAATGTGPFGCDREPEGQIQTSPETMAEFIVAFHDESLSEGAMQAVLDEAGDEVDVTLVQEFELGVGAILVQASEPLDEGRQAELLGALLDTCEVRYAHPNFVMETTG